MKCPHCSYEPKEGKFASRSLRSHITQKHPQEWTKELAKPALEASNQTKEPAVNSGEVTFFSPRLPFLTVIVTPGEWRMVSGPAGDKMVSVDGLTAEFDNGIYKTADPTIIAYLSGDKETAKKLGLVDKNGRARVYDDPRFPIFTEKLLHSYGEKRA